MKLIDVTLRDGGFICDFDWPIEVAQKHFELCGRMGIEVVELGYWKQTEKSNGPFYNMNEDILSSIVSGRNSFSAVAVIVDFHYCSKNLLDYPRQGETRIEIIRLTSRREDLPQARIFARNLRLHTGLKISLQIINVTGYSINELSSLVGDLSEDPDIDIIGFADSHGGLNLAADYPKYSKIFENLSTDGQLWGMHLHNHSGRAVANYWALETSGCSYMDVSCRGLGKGAGNLPTEFVLRNEDLPNLLDYYIGFTDGPLSMGTREAFYLIAGRLSITDNYARLGYELNLSAQGFYQIAKRLTGVKRDSFDREHFLEIMKNTA